MKKSAIIVAIVFMMIGFAAVSTSLIINGNAKVSENNEDFSVIFTAASLDGEDVYSTAVDDTKKTITFTSKDLMKAGDTSILTYEVTNNSSNYDAEVRVICVPKDGKTAKYTSIKNKLENNATVVKAKEAITGTLTINLDKQSTEEVSEEYTCTLQFNAVERDKLGYNGPTEWTFDYTGSEQTFTAPVSGTYKLETWGAQGGSYSSNYFGGYGGYSSGEMTLEGGKILYINVGGQGVALTGGYNGGGNVNDVDYGKAGGGATHIADLSGLLSTFETKQENVLIVSGGGGGAANRGSGYGDGNGGSAGGITGNNGESVNHTNGYGYGYGTGGSQTTGGYMVWIKVTSSGYRACIGTFGKGFGSTVASYVACGGGAGFYGGGGSSHGGAGGGSGYIGNTILTEKVMYCYNCAESSEEATKTISTTCTSATPTENCSKQGNGYARITLIKQ